MNPSDLIIPLLLAGTAACGTGRRVNVYAALTRGAEDGLTVLLHVIPALVGLLTAVSMFRASGAMDALARLCAPVLNLLGIPAETVPLMLVRPVSGSGALAVASDLMASHGPDSYIGRVAAVMLGSTETTFYTIAVYFGSAGIVRTRHTVPAALAADLTGFLTAALTVRLMFGPLHLRIHAKKARQSRAFSFSLCRFSHLSFKCARRRSRFPRMSVTYVSPLANSSGETLWQVWNIAVPAPAASAMASATR